MEYCQQRDKSEIHSDENIETIFSNIHIIVRTVYFRVFTICIYIYCI